HRSRLVSYYIVVVVMLITCFIMWKITDSKTGIIFHAIREDEVAAQSLGKAPNKIRLTAFVVGSMIMGLAGGLYATFYAFVSPQDVLPTLTFQIWAMLIVGGSGNNQGGILGAFLIWAAWTASGWMLSKFAPVEAQLYTGTLQYIMIGMIIVGMLLWRPQGLLPEKLIVSQ
ncbi:MAG: branched-chain amino acid ABC transporter permease, partial [bacterium]